MKKENFPLYKGSGWKRGGGEYQRSDALSRCIRHPRGRWILNKYGLGNTRELRSYSAIMLLTSRAIFEPFRLVLNLLYVSFKWAVEKELKWVCLSFEYSTCVEFASYQLDPLVFFFFCQKIVVPHVAPFKKSERRSIDSLMHSGVDPSRMIAPTLPCNSANVASASITHGKDMLYIYEHSRTEALLVAARKGLL
jgi:hypothetical protein